MKDTNGLVVAPVRERGLKLLIVNLLTIIIMVAPVRERGLKFLSASFAIFIVSSLP